MEMFEIYNGQEISKMYDRHQTTDLGSSRKITTTNLYLGILGFKCSKWKDGETIEKSRGKVLPVE